MAKGRRVEIALDDGGEPDLNACMPSEPGDYVGPLLGYTGGLPSVFFMLPVEEGHPDHGVRHVTSPPHAFVEEDDGSLTISPSILAMRPKGKGPGWHGYLTRGEWVSA